jgi:hypothetical protein
MARTPIGTADWGDDLNADLNGIEALAQAAYDLAIAGGGGGGAVSSVNSKTGTVVLNADDLSDGVSKKMFLATERTKLTGVATGATANSTDAFLLGRANHTGTQPQSSITNLTNDLAAKAPLAHSHGIADMPAGTIIAAKWTGSAWPARPTSRTDITVQWIGGSEGSPPTGGISGDVWIRSMV